MLQIAFVFVVSFVSASGRMKIGSVVASVPAGGFKLPCSGDRLQPEERSSASP